MNWQRLVAIAALSVSLLGALLTTGCATTHQYDYSNYREHPPVSILVLPPLNESLDVNAPYIYLSTITRPLAEAGYYVYPVAVVDAFMKENGLADPAEMQAVPLNKINQIIGPDAVLYTTIKAWGQQYRVLSSETTVDVTARLVDARSGVLLWEGTAHSVQGSGNGQSGLLANAIVALVAQIANTVNDKTRKAAQQANAQMIDDPDTGLPLGPYNPQHVTDPRRE